MDAEAPTAAATHTLEYHGWHITVQQITARTDATAGVWEARGYTDHAVVYFSSPGATLRVQWSWLFPRFHRSFDAWDIDYMIDNLAEEVQAMEAAGTFAAWRAARPWLADISEAQAYAVWKENGAVAEILPLLIAARAEEEDDHGR